MNLWILTLLGKHTKKADVIKKANLFKSYGGGYWHPCWIPTQPELISIGNNVTIAADVRFYEHDMVRLMFDDDPNYIGPYIKYYTGPITIEDNVVIGARAIILYNVTIGKKCIGCCWKCCDKRCSTLCNCWRKSGKSDRKYQRFIEEKNGIQWS